MLLHLVWNECNWRNSESFTVHLNCVYTWRKKTNDNNILCVSAFSVPFAIDRNSIKKKYYGNYFAFACLHHLIFVSKIFHAVIATLKSIYLVCSYYTMPSILYINCIVFRYLIITKKREGKGQPTTTTKENQKKIHFKITFRLFCVWHLILLESNIILSCKTDLRR